MTCPIQLMAALTAESLKPCVHFSISLWTQQSTILTKWAKTQCWPKIDTKSAFRLLPVHPADCCLLSMKRNKQIFIDTCLPFELTSAPKIFNVLAYLLSWILEQQQVTPVMHYLDDFLTMAPPDSSMCANNFQIIKDTCSKLGVSLDLEKIKGPSQCLTFLGITLDTQLMQARLPDDKLSQVCNEVAAWLSCKNAAKGQILSLIGLLQNATWMVTPVRTVASRMYKAAACLKKLSHITRFYSWFSVRLEMAATLRHPLE